MTAPRSVNATVLTVTSPSDTTPHLTVYVTGTLPSRRLYSYVLSGVLAAERAGDVTELETRVAETGTRRARPTRA